ncbi:MAG TPA: PHP domain-containing protein [Candidatus Saccharimonadales bacterium]
MYRLDLHTHSSGSPDGSLTIQQLERMFDGGRLNGVAITDHDSIQTAQYFQGRLGADRIIIGEEITTSQGEIIGLYLQHVIPAGLTAAETVRLIKEQGGLVYIPHPFETVRKGIALDVLETIADTVDIIEVHNGRAIFQNFGPQAVAWAAKHKIVTAASSDAHGFHGWGRTCSILKDVPVRDTLVMLLRDATLVKGTVGYGGLLYPKLNRIRKKRS